MRRSKRLRRHWADSGSINLMPVLVEPVLSPDGGRGIGRRQLETGASAVIAGRGGERIWQRDDETIEAFEARVEAAAAEYPSGNRHNLTDESWQQRRDERPEAVASLTRVD